MVLVYGCVSVSQSSPTPFFSKPQFITQSDLSFIFIILFLFCDLGLDLRYVFILYILLLCQRRRLILRIKSTTKKNIQYNVM